MPRDIFGDAYAVEVIQPDGSTVTVPHIAVAWEHNATELPFRLRLQVPNVALDGWSPAMVANGAYWRLLGGPADNMSEITRGRFLGVGAAVDPNQPLSPRGYDLTYHLLKSKVDCYYDDQASAAFIIADLAGQWGIPIDWQHFDGPQTIVGPLYGQKKQIADVVKECLQRARAKGGGEWIIRWAPAGLQCVTPAGNQRVYWFVEGESVFGGNYDNSIEDLITRVQVLRPAPTGGSPVRDIQTGRFTGTTTTRSPATTITTLDGHTEFGILQEIIEAGPNETDEDATARAQVYLNEAGMPVVQLTLLTPLLPDIQKGDRHRATLPTLGLDGYFDVEGFSADEGSRSMQLVLSADYRDLFSYQAATTEAPQQDTTVDAVTALGTPGTSTPGQYNPNTPPVLQTSGWTCSASSTAWLLQAMGKTASETDVVNYLGSGINNDVGLTDATGAGIVSMLQRTYNVAADNAAVTFDQVLARAGKTAIVMGGAAWDHWTGVAGAVDNDTLQLANPAPGWCGVQQTLSRADFARLGPFYAVWAR